MDPHSSVRLILPVPVDHHQRQVIRDRRPAPEIHDLLVDRIDQRRRWPVPEKVEDVEQPLFPEQRPINRAGFRDAIGIKDQLVVFFHLQLLV